MLIGDQVNNRESGGETLSKEIQPSFGWFTKPVASIQAWAGIPLHQTMNAEKKEDTFGKPVEDWWAAVGWFDRGQTSASFMVDVRERLGPNVEQWFEEYFNEKIGSEAPISAGDPSKFPE